MMSKTLSVRQALLPALCLGLISMASGARAQSPPTIIFPSVNIDGGQVIPANASPAMGTASITLDPTTNLMTWSISFSGLTSAQTAAHFHVGPPGVNGPISINIGVGSPIAGSIMLSPTQVSQLTSGDLYINVHTAMFPAGEIRGQVLPPQAAAVPSGAGCIGSNGVLMLSNNGLPGLGNLAFAMDVSGGAPGESVFLFLGASVAPVPIPIAPGGCSIQLEIFSALAFINLGISPVASGAVGPGGSVTLGVPIPNFLNLLGVSLTVQGLVISPMGTLGTTNALTLTLGS